MLNNFIYAKTKDLFIEQLEAHQILDEAIVFIEDTKEIWNHGTYFAGISDSGFDQETLDQINAEIENVRNSIPSLKDNYIDFVMFVGGVTLTENEYGLNNIEITNDVILKSTGLTPVEFKNGIDSGKQLRLIIYDTISYPYASVLTPSDSDHSIVANVYEYKESEQPVVFLCNIQMSIENEEIVTAGYINGVPYATIFPGIATIDQLDNKIVFDYTSFGLPNISEQVLTEDQVMTACGMSATDLYNKVRSGTEVAFKVTPDEGTEMVLLAINVSIQENWFAISFVDLFMLVYDNGTISVIFDFTLGYQQRLVSGTNIKTINGQSLLGEGDINISTDVDLTDYALKEDIPTTTSQLTNDSGFLTEHQNITGKQDVIEDLETIREGAAKGATALQSVPGGYATETWVGEQGFLTEHQDISHKQDVINDLNDIRQKANSALQNVPDEYITETELNTAINSVAFTEDYGSEVVMPVSNIVSMSQEAYDALTEKNPNTIYLIV